MAAKLKLFLDLDGILIGSQQGRPALAPHADAFVTFALAHFDCYWATTHCHGDEEQVLDYLTPFMPAALLDKLTAIKPTRFSVLKTEAMDGDFFWIDDQPLQAELADLQRRNLHDRWIEINTRLRPDDLQHAVDELKRILERRGLT